MIEIKLGIIVICAVCKLIGELWWHNAQRFIMPIIMGIAVSILIGWVQWFPIHIPFWTVNFLFIHLHSFNFFLPVPTILFILPMIAPLCMGYKVYGPSDGFDRGMWLFLIVVTAGLGPVLTHHLSWIAYVPTCIIAGIWGATTRGLWNVIIAPISGALIGSIILWVH